ncbi:MAG: hypothetical protein ACLGHN_04425 [Bacteriovoracia bacterium]
MRFFLTLLISFQMISASLAVELGEKKSFSGKKHLFSTLARSEAQSFEGLLRSELKKAKTEGVLYSNKKYNPIFREISRGSWIYQADGNKVSFTTADIYKGQMVVNGKVLKFKGVPLAELEKQAEKLFVKKTSFLEKLYYNTFGIQEASACELVCAAVIVVVVVAIVGKAVFELMIKPEKMVKRLNEMKKKLDNDAMMCEEAGSDYNKYSSTFSLASSIGERSAMGSMSEPSEAMEYAIKKQLESGSRKNEDCFQIMNEIGKKVDIDIPIPSQRQIQMRELAGARLQNEEVDVANAAFNLCSSFNRLGACMENFVAAHVNDSDIDNFKDKAEDNYYRYERKSKASRQ